MVVSYIRQTIQNGAGGFTQQSASCSFIGAYASMLLYMEGLHIAHL